MWTSAVPRTFPFPCRSIAPTATPDVSEHLGWPAESRTNSQIRGVFAGKKEPPLAKLQIGYDTCGLAAVDKVDNVPACRR
jgi:hypothetical protein